MKKLKLLRRIIVFLILLIVIELLVMAIIKLIRERNINRINMLNDVISVDDGYVVVGMSDFHNSKSVKEKNYEFTSTSIKPSKKQRILATQSRIAKYDKDKNLVWENTFENNYDSTFYSVLEVDDGYIAVGSFVSRYSQIEDNVRDGLIVKYDLNGKMIWNRAYSVLSDTEFYKIIHDDDNYVVIGQSIYQNMEVGSHITGGGIIVRYDKDGNMLAHNNYGGNKSGSFNDIVKVNDGYIVCGKDAVNYGIVVKFPKDFNRDEKDFNLISKKVVWQRTYSNTDNIGFTSMIKKNDKLYVAGAINVSNDKDEEENPIFKYEAGIVIYDIKGKYIGKEIFENGIHHRFNSAIESDDKILLSMLLDVDNVSSEKQNSALVKFNFKDNSFTEELKFNDKNNYIINRVVSNNDKILYVGTSDNKCTLFGCDYTNILDYYEN